MCLKEWAKREIELVEEKRKNDDYYMLCCKSALEAFNILTEQGHSGYSIKITQGILNRLINGETLTPIEDVPEVWNDISVWNGPEVDYKQYQCNRMSGLYKYVYPDGTVKYNDVNRIKCFNFHDPSSTFTNGYINEVINERYPVTLPYIPGDRISVCVEDFLTDPANGDFDTTGILYAILPTGDKVSIKLYTHYENGETAKQITKEQYYELKSKSIKSGLYKK